MPSNALQIWLTTRAAALDEIDTAHSLVRGTGPGKRLATQQINQAYVMLLSSHFQGYCRDLYAESVDSLVASITPQALRQIVRTDQMLHLKLDRGNPNPGNIGADYNRLGVRFWTAVEALDSRNTQRRVLLEELNEWRNAVAHQDFDPGRLAGQTVVWIQQVREWRGACHALAHSFDVVMQNHILKVVGKAPW